jgi:hypothetical protein
VIPPQAAASSPRSAARCGNAAKASFLVTLYKIVFDGARAPTDDPMFEDAVVRRTDDHYELVLDVVDQAHLQGLLGQLHELDLTLVSAEPVTAKG